MEARTAQFVVHDRPLDITCSVGRSIFPDRGGGCTLIMAIAVAFLVSDDPVTIQQFSTPLLKTDLCGMSACETTSIIVQRKTSSGEKESRC
jgi:hypothetical protein